MDGYLFKLFRLSRLAIKLPLENRGAQLERRNYPTDNTPAHSSLRCEWTNRDKTEWKSKIKLC